MSFFEFPHTRTYDSDLGWLIKKVTSYDEAINALNEWIAENEPKMNDLLAFMEALEEGDLPEGMKQGLYQWASENMLDLVGQLVKMVFFGLTDSGYFVAYIPESWNDLIFNTSGYDVFLADVPEYGHLILSY